MDQYARAWMESPAGQAAMARRHEEEKKYINATVENALKVDCAGFSSHLDLVSDKQDVFDHLKKIQEQKTLDKEKDHEFLSQIGITISQDILADHPSLVISKMVNRITDYYMHDISLSDLSKPTTIDTVKYLSQYFPDETSSRFRDEYHQIRHIPNDEDRKRLKILYPAIWNYANPPYYDYDSMSSYEQWKDTLPDDVKLKIVNQILSCNTGLTEEELKAVKEEYKQLSGNYPGVLENGKTRIENIFDILVQERGWNFGGHALGMTALKEIEDSGQSDILLQKFIKTNNSHDILGTYYTLQKYEHTPFIKHLEDKILESCGEDLLNCLDSAVGIKVIFRGNKKILFHYYQEDRLNPEQIEKLKGYFADECTLEEKGVFQEKGDIPVVPRNISSAILHGIIDDADIEKLNILSWDKKSKHEALSNLLYNKDALGAGDAIKNRYLKTTICLLNAIDIDEYISNTSSIENVALIACYCKDSISDFDKIMKQAAKQIRKDQSIGYGYEPLMTELASRGEKLFSAEKLISYRKRGIEVDYPENPEVYEFNEKFLCEASYHHSDGSHTTFLNEMLWYGNKEGTVLALNNDASPFTKVGFFRDKFEAMPFNMFFNRELKNNGEADLTDFMAYVATNINEDKKGVIKDIWTSLGGKLRSDPRVQKIMHDTDQIIKTRFPSRLDIVRNKISENQAKTQTDGQQGSNSPKFSGPKGPNGRDDR